MTVTGSGFTKVSKVLFGSAAGTSMHVVSPTKISVVSPGHAAGTVQVRIVNAYGESAVSTTSAFGLADPASVPATAVVSGRHARG